MERELFRLIARALRRLGNRRKSRRQTFTDAAILAVYYWAAMNDRAVWWACRPENWPPGLRRGPLPSQPCMSRRLRSDGVLKLRRRLERLVLRSGRSHPLVCIIDGKPLPIAGHSRDRQAGYGRAARGMARGYKLHLLMSLCGTVLGWRVAPMNADERTIGLRLLADLPGPCYLLADTNYDSNKLFARAWEHGAQLLVPRRSGPGKGLGHCRHHPTRLRSLDYLENTVNDFGRDLHRMRRAIERYFGTLSSTGGGLTCLPGFVRGHHRVSLWIHAKIVLNQLRADRRKAA